MKFQQIEAFERHLQEAFPAHPSQVYGVAMPQKDERVWCEEKILVRIRDLDSEVEITQTAVEDIKTEELFSPSLFAQTKLIIVEGAEELKKDHPLIDEMSHLPEKTFVVLSGTSIPKGVYERLKKELVFLDLSSEKPWERTERLSGALLTQAKEAGKQLSSDAAAFMMQVLPSDFAILSRELEKAICYVAAADTIDLKSVQAICTARAEVKGWKVSEDLVWKGKIAQSPFEDSNEFFGLIGQVRYHLNTGLQIAQSLEANATHFPSLRPKQLETYKRIAKTLRSTYFSTGLLALFDLELKAKSSSVSPSLLWDHFVYRLKRCRN